MAELDASKVVRRVRQKLQVSQEGLSRLLNATKGAVQHWERGRNRPDLARLLALRQLCPPSPERKELDGLIRQMQERVTPLAVGRPDLRSIVGGRKAGLGPVISSEDLEVLRRQNQRLEREVTKLQAALDRRAQQVRILEDLAKDLQGQMAKLRASASQA